MLRFQLGPRRTAAILIALVGNEAAPALALHDVEEAGSREQRGRIFDAWFRGSIGAFRAACIAKVTAGTKSLEQCFTERTSYAGLRACNRATRAATISSA